MEGLAANTRVCTRCHECHPIEFFNRDKTRPDGVYPQCKACTRANCRRVYRKYHERHVEMKRAWKAANPERRREIDRRWQQSNPERVCAHIAKWREANPEKALEWAKNKPDRVRAIQARFRSVNADRLRERDRQYAAANPAKMKVKNARRRARKLNATPDWVDHELLEFIYSECPEGWHVDHVYPLKGRNSCGLHVPWNLQYLPASENCKKSNKVPVAQEAW